LFGIPNKRLEKEIKPMTPQEREHQLNQSIRQYQLEDWIETIPDGFRIVRLYADLKATWFLISIMMGFVPFLVQYSQIEAGDSAWITLFFLAILALVAFGLFFVLTRNVVFDLENREVCVTLLGSVISRNHLQGYVSLSHRHGTTLFLEFEDQSKIRIADMGAEKELENLESFILEALAMI